MAVLPQVQLLSWSSARLLALLLNSLCGLFHYLERDKNATIGVGRGKADIDWDTPLGLRLIQESLLAIDRHFKARGFHPTIFNAIRNLSSQSDLLLKERMEQTRNRDAELFGKLEPLFMVRDRTELAKHKLVDEQLRWADKEQSDRRKAWEEEGGKGTKEQKWIKEKAVGLTCLLSSMHPNCEMSGKCAEYFVSKENIGTSLTGQLFFLQLIIEQFDSKCSPQMNHSSSFSNFSVKNESRPNSTTFLTSEKCANVFDELNAWTIRKNRKQLARANAGTLALLTEQTFLCGHFGFVQFASPQLLITLLSWQHPKLGCWTAQKPDLMNSFGIRTAIELNRLRTKQLEKKKNVKNKIAEEMSSREDAFCLPHLSIVAGLALSSVYLRFLLDPGLWPEHSLADQLVEMDGVLAEDQFRQFPYLEWVRDSLLAGVEQNAGLQLLRPPSSSWSPDLIAFVFLLFFILIFFVIFLHFFGKGEEHYPSTLRKKMYPYALKKL